MSNVPGMVTLSLLTCLAVMKFLVVSVGTDRCKQMLSEYFLYALLAAMVNTVEVPVSTEIDCEIIKLMLYCK